jgi:hypothetical protein
MLDVPFFRMSGVRKCVTDYRYDIGDPFPRDVSTFSFPTGIHLRTIFFFMKLVDWRVDTPERTWLASFMNHESTYHHHQLVGM